MKHYQYLEFKAIAENISNASYLFLEFAQIRDIYESAVSYNRLQNSCLKDGYPDDVVKDVYLYDERVNDAKYFSIRAYNSLTIKEWFKLLYATQMNKTYQEVKKLVQINTNISA